jgi:hypothetical protein
MSKDNTEIPVNEPKDDDVLKLKKEDFLKIVEDPYFQYLVEKKTREKIRAYLILVGSTVLAILAYGGWEIKSAKEHINKAKEQVEKEQTTVQSTSKEIQQAAENAKKQQEQTSDTEKSIRETVTSARNFAKQSSELTNGMLMAAQDNIKTSQAAQKSFFDQQGNLLATVKDINEAAKLQLDKADKRFDDVDKRFNDVNALVDKANTQVKDTDKQIEVSSNKLIEVGKQAEIINTTKTNLDKLTDNANLLKRIQQRVLEGGLINATVFMRSKKATTIKMLDPDNPEDKTNDWVLTFTRFELSDKKLSVWGNAKKGDARSINFAVLDMHAQPTDAVRDFVPLPNKIPFQIQLNFAYHTFFSVDFASLNISGIPTQKELQVLYSDKIINKRW